MDRLEKTSLTKMLVNCYIYFIDIAEKNRKMPFYQKIRAFFYCPENE